METFDIPKNFMADRDTELPPDLNGNKNKENFVAAAYPPEFTLSSDSYDS